MKRYGFLLFVIPYLPCAEKEYRPSVFIEIANETERPVSAFAQPNIGKILLGTINPGQEMVTPDLLQYSQLSRAPDKNYAVCTYKIKLYAGTEYLGVLNFSVSSTTADIFGPGVGHSTSSHHDRPGKFLLRVDLRGKNLQDTRSAIAATSTKLR